MLCDRTWTKLFISLARNRSCVTSVSPARHGKLTDAWRKLDDEARRGEARPRKYGNDQTPDVTYGDASRRYVDTELKTRVLRVYARVMAASPCVKRTSLMPRENATRFMGRVTWRERRQARARVRILRECTLHALRSCYSDVAAMTKSIHGHFGCIAPLHNAANSMNRAFSRLFIHKSLDRDVIWALFERSHSIFLENPSVFRILDLVSQNLLDLW